MRLIRFPHISFEKQKSQILKYHTFSLWESVQHRMYRTRRGKDHKMRVARKPEETREGLLDENY